MPKNERDFKGIWIPREIYLDEELSWVEKFFLSEIDSLARNGQCFASNAYFGEFFKLSKDRVSKIISGLAKKGYIEVNLFYKNGTKEIEKRILTTNGYKEKIAKELLKTINTPIGVSDYTPIGQDNHTPIGQVNYTPIGEDNQDINTDIINTNIINTNNKNISPQIENLRQRYSNDQLKTIDDYLDMIRHTRKSKKISESVILKMYETWNSYPSICVEYGLYVHTSNIEHHDKPEKYTFAIIKKTKESDAEWRLKKLRGKTDSTENSNSKLKEWLEDE